MHLQHKGVFLFIIRRKSCSCSLGCREAPPLSVRRKRKVRLLRSESGGTENRTADPLGPCLLTLQGPWRPPSRGSKPVHHFQLAVFHSHKRCVCLVKAPYFIGKKTDSGRRRDFPKKPCK